MSVEAERPVIVAGLGDKPLLVIGRAGMDLYPDPPGTRTEDASRFFACLGGSSANIAVALVRQGVAAALATRVSDDAIGRFAINELDRYGVDRRHVTPIGGEARNTLAIVESRVEDHQSVLYRNGAADFGMTEDDIAAIDFAAYSAVITTGTVFAAEPSRSAVYRAFELARAAGLPLIFDVDYRPYSWHSAEEAADVYSRAATRCDVIVGNDLEFGFMAGDYTAGLDRARALRDAGAALVVYKRGEHGAVSFTADDTFESGVYPAEPLKPTGAGDAFMGSLIAALAQGRSVREAVLRGSAAAAIVVGRVGCAPAMPTRDELDAFQASSTEPEFRELES